MITVTDLEAIEKLNSSGYNDSEISKLLNISYRVVNTYRKDMQLPARKGVVKDTTHCNPINYYTVYNRKDFVIAQGTARECAEQMGIKLSSFYSAVCRTQKTGGKIGCRFILVTKLADDVEEDCEL